MGELLELRNKYTKLCGNILVEDDNITAKSKEIESLSKKNSGFDVKITNLQEKIKSLQAQVDAITIERTTISGNIDNLSKAVKEHEERRNVLSAESKSISDSISKMEMTMCLPLKNLSVSDMFDIYLNYIIAEGLDNFSSSKKPIKVKTIREKLDWKSLRSSIKGFDDMASTPLGYKIPVRRTEHGVEVCAVDFDSFKSITKSKDWISNIVGVRFPDGRFIKYGFELDNKAGVIGNEIRSFYSFGKIFISEYARLHNITATMDLFDSLSVFDKVYNYFNRLVVFKAGSDPLKSEVVAHTNNESDDNGLGYEVGKPIPEAATFQWNRFYQPLFTDGIYDMYINRSYSGWEDFKRALFALNAEMDNFFLDASAVFKEGFLV